MRAMPETGKRGPGLRRDLRGAVPGLAVREKKGSTGASGRASATAGRTVASRVEADFAMGDALR